MNGRAKPRPLSARDLQVIENARGTSATAEQVAGWINAPVEKVREIMDRVA